MNNVNVLISAPVFTYDNVEEMNADTFKKVFEDYVAGNIERINFDKLDIMVELPNCSINYIYKHSPDQDTNNAGEYVFVRFKDTSESISRILRNVDSTTVDELKLYNRPIDTITGDTIVIKELVEKLFDENNLVLKKEELGYIFKAELSV